MKERRISIAIPASIVADVPSHQLKTYKLGQIARASAIYCINEIFVFADRDFREQKKDSTLICEILQYMETPQYLRRRLFPLTPALRFAGMLPPLNTPNHPTWNQLAQTRNGEYREGVVIKTDSSWSLVDVGLERPLRIFEAIPAGKRRTFRILKESKEVATLELADPSAIQEYWGYKVTELRRPLGQFMRKRTFDLYVLTSRLGSPIADYLEEVQERLETASSILVAFGSPKEGLKEILAREELSEKAADFCLNTIPGQGTQSVRTEEAVQATLAIINLLIRKIDARFIRHTK
jgi:predicted SPOUT superfamily RNA methylase MTH1